VKKCARSISSFLFMSQKATIYLAFGLNLHLTGSHSPLCHSLDSFALSFNSKPVQFVALVFGWALQEDRLSLQRKMLPQVYIIIAICSLQLLTKPCECILDNWVAKVRGVLRPYNSHYYDMINSRLVDEVDSDSPMANLMAALNWLRNSYDNGAPASDADPKGDKQYLLALVQFTSLVKLMVPDNRHCDMIGHDIMKNNELSSGQRLIVPDTEVGPLRRIDSVIRQVAVEHAERCRLEYPKMFKAARDGADNERLANVKSMMDSIIETSTRRVFPQIRFVDPRTILREKAKGVPDLRGAGQAKAVLNFMKNRTQRTNSGEMKFLVVRSDPRRRGKWIVWEQQVREIFDKYAASSCSHLIEVGENYLKPALYEEQLFGTRSYRATNEDVAELMIWMQYYRLCARLVNEDREALIRNVIEKIWESDWGW